MKTPATYVRRRSSPGTNEQVVDDVIGAELRLFYSTMENQDIPAQFLALLEQLDQKTKLTRN